jgi:hypothetical protein
MVVFEDASQGHHLEMTELDLKIWGDFLARAENNQRNAGSATKPRALSAPGLCYGSGCCRDITICRTGELRRRLSPAAWPYRSW